MNKNPLLPKLHLITEEFGTTLADIGNLSKCIEDVKNAALDSDTGPEDPENFKELRDRLEKANRKLPPLYREAVFNPYVKCLDELGEEGFNKILLMDRMKTGLAGMMIDIAHAILQNGEGYCEWATDAFQEVVSDIYDGFLSSENRTGVKPPDKCVIPPLVKWGNPNFGPYTWPIDATTTFEIQTSIVNLPPANAKGGLLAWATLGHETGGHDILHADTGLTAQLQEAVRSALKEKNIGHGLPEYWSARIDETASDILGILNMGPAAGIGLIGYFRGLNYAYIGKPVLRNNGPESDLHPADILRGYLAASAVGLLNFSGADNWAKIIEAETNKDLSEINIAGEKINVEDARESTKIVASTIMRTTLQSLENHNLAQIQNWYNQDENITNYLRSLLITDNPLPIDYKQNIYATHVVAAAVMAALVKDADIPSIFKRMQAILKTMHDGNPSWGPLYVQYSGNIVPCVVYSRSIEYPFTE
ncbi:hypothetical protein [Sporomusa sp. KB1]|jgi:hypothetical protein|uniref:hypothetical protein n=1 Tax=Sporomusa sp. KB1 TaxID=943346 RepID=UPI0011ADC19A|nr:hypothetical protein [Sporomusa sp. KB1]TWH46754.1 hypothetical protein Salpa_2764 [Sporomusa sp. KB1]